MHRLCLALSVLCAVAAPVAAHAQAQPLRPQAQLGPGPLPLVLNLGGGINSRQGAAVFDLFGAVQNGVNAIANGIGKPNGIATLDNKGQVPLPQIPATVALPTALPTLVIFGTGSYSAFAGSATLDGRAWADDTQTTGYFADYGALSNSKDTFKNTEVIGPLTGPGAMRDNKLIQLRDFDTTNYEASKFRVISNALRVVNSGRNDGNGYVKQWKDQHGIWSISIGNTGGVDRGVSGVVAEALQFGTGVATNEFSASSFQGAPGQPALLSPVTGVAYNYYGNIDATHNVYGVQANMYGYTATSAFRAASVPALGQPGAAYYGLQMNELTVSGPAISMPNPVFGDIKGRINYGAGESYFNTAQNAFIWTVNGTEIARINASYNVPNTPASSSSPCATGDHLWDANFEYRCVATNTWKRAALSTW